jgi:hypothetical protein
VQQKLLDHLVGAVRSPQRLGGCYGHRCLTPLRRPVEPRRHAWALGLLYQPLIDFDKSIVKYANIKRAPGGASNDLHHGRILNVFNAHFMATFTVTA